MFAPALDSNVRDRTLGSKPRGAFTWRHERVRVLTLSRRSARGPPRQLILSSLDRAGRKVRAACRFACELGVCHRPTRTDTARSNIVARACVSWVTSPPDCTRSTFEPIGRRLDIVALTGRRGHRLATRTRGRVQPDRALYRSIRCSNPAVSQQQQVLAKEQITQFYPRGHRTCRL